MVEVEKRAETVRSKRSLRLSAAAIAILRDAVSAKWSENPSLGRLTREVRGELLGISGVTVDKLLAGRIVDRSTAQLAFKNVGLQWEDAFERNSEERPQTSAIPVPGPATPQVAQKLSAPIAVSRRPILKLPAVGVGAFGLILVCALLTGRSTGSTGDSPEKWKIGFLQTLLKGDQLYNLGQYHQAQLLVDHTVAVARSKNSARDLASTIRMQGDLAAERGDFGEAKSKYEQAFNLCAALKADACLPPIQETIGDLETRMGNAPTARACLHDSLVGYRRLNDWTGVSMAERDLGTLAYQQKAYKAASAYFTESLKAVENQNKPELVTDIHARQALLMKDEGQIAQARAVLRTCLQFWEARGHPRWVAVMKYDLGIVEAAAKRQRTAAQLLIESHQAFLAVGDKAGAKKAQEAFRTSASPL